MTGAEDQRKVARTTATALGIVVATVLALLVVYEIRRIVMWIIIAAFFAIALNPAVNWIERRVKWCPRWLATLVVFLVVVIVLAGLVALFVTPLIHEGTQLSKQLPGLINDAKAGRGPIGKLLERFRVVDWIQHHKAQLQSYASSVGGGAFSVLRRAATAFVALLSIFVLSYLMVLEAPRITATSLTPFSAARTDRIQRVANDCARAITGYITGNLLISVICGVLTYIVLLVTGVPFGGLIALFVAIADLIPLIGATLGAVVAVVAGFIHSVPAGIVLIVFFIIYQQAENHLLQPLILSRTVKLNPLTVLISILLGVELAGILGALLAIPVAGIIQIIVRDLWNGRRARTVIEPDAPADIETPPDSDPAEG